MTESTPKEKTIKKHTIMKVSMSLLFFCMLFLSITASMCPKYVPLVEVPLYSIILILGILWIFKAQSKLSVLARFLLVTALGIVINVGVSYMVHHRAFPYEMFDESTKKRIEAHKKEMLDNYKYKKTIENNETKD